MILFLQSENAGSISLRVDNIVVTRCIVKEVQENMQSVYYEKVRPRSMSNNTAGRHPRT